MAEQKDGAMAPGARVVAVGLQGLVDEELVADFVRDEIGIEVLRVVDVLGVTEIEVVERLTMADVVALVSTDGVD